MYGKRKKKQRKKESNEQHDSDNFCVFIELLQYDEFETVHHAYCTVFFHKSLGDEKTMQTHAYRIMESVFYLLDSHACCRQYGQTGVTF